MHIMLAALELNRATELENKKKTLFVDTNSSIQPVAAFCHMTTLKETIPDQGCSHTLLPCRAFQKQFGG